MGKCQYWNTVDKFGCITKLLHWSLAVLVIIEVTLIGLRHYVFNGEAHKDIAMFLIKDLHKPIGVLVLGVGSVALLWHLMNIKPRLPEGIPLWQRFSASVVHLLLYVSVLTMPLSGIIMSAAGGRPVDFFHLTVITFGIQKDPAVAERFFGVHEFTASILLALVALHIAAALKHHFIDKNNVLKRML